jgi:hypothetical protein
VRKTPNGCIPSITRPAQRDTHVPDEQTPYLVIPLIDVHPF